MSEQKRGFAPTDPSVEDDLLAPEPKRQDAEPEDPTALHDDGPEEELADEEPTGEEPTEHEPADDEPIDEEPTDDDAATSRRPGRQFVRIGWVAVAVLAVVGALMVVELVRVTSAINNNTCVAKAQAHFTQALGPGVSAQYAALDRLTAQNQLNKCGQ